MVALNGDRFVRRSTFVVECYSMLGEKGCGKKPLVVSHLSFSPLMFIMMLGQKLVFDGFHVSSGVD